MKRILFIASTAFLFSCGTGEQAKEEVAEITEEITITEKMFGQEITEEGALTTVEFLEQFDQLFRI